jgi:hypothetical protein
MTPRERKAPGGTSAIAPTGVTLRADASTVATPMSGVAAPPHQNSASPGFRVPSWEEWCQNASEAQRNEILALAKKQGLIYSQQIPAPANGVHHKTPLEESPNVPLAQLLSGNIDGLLPVSASALAFADKQLDVAQREAVLRALFSPDAFLLQGSPGEPTVRVLAEILQQTATRGQRVLLLANRSATLDATILTLTECRSILALRFQAPGEKLSPELLPLTLDKRRQTFLQQTLEGARTARAEAQARLAQRQSEDGCWNSLQDLVAALTDVRQRQERCREGLCQLAEQVQRDAASATAGVFSSAMTQITRTHSEGVKTLKEAAAEIASQKQAFESSRAELERDAQVLRPLAEAKQHGRWWTFAWWQATLRGRVLANWADLQNRLHDLTKLLTALEQKRQETGDKERQLELWFQTENARQVSAETERRRLDGEKQRAEIEREIDRLNGDWHGVLSRLEQDNRPHEPSRAAVDQARAKWENQKQRDIAAGQLAGRWEEYVTQGGEQLALRLPEWANVLAGTMMALKTERAFADQAVGPFDMVVLLDAEEFSEAEINRVAKHGQRLLLVAQSQAQGESVQTHAKNGVRSSTANGTPPPSFFRQLWQKLHCDSRRIHYAWVRENERLCCTLRPIDGQDRRYIEIERVADFPEIELRILARPKAPPLLAQVVFPPAMNILQAKEFIYRELEEVAVHGQQGGAWLGDEAERFLFHLSPVALADTAALELEKGLREWVAPATGNTCCLEFNKAAGWTRPQVDQWLDRHLQVRDLGRTMVLRGAAH